MNGRVYMTTKYFKSQCLDFMLKSSSFSLSVCTWTSSMVCTMNISCKSSMAPSIQLLKGADLFAYSRNNCSTVSKSFSVLCRNETSIQTFLLFFFLNILINLKYTKQVETHTALPPKPLCVSG